MFQAASYLCKEYSLPVTRGQRLEAKAKTRPFISQGHDLFCPSVISEIEDSSRKPQPMLRGTLDQIVSLLQIICPY